MPQIPLLFGSFDKKPPSAQPPCGHEQVSELKLWSPFWAASGHFGEGGTENAP